MKPIKYAQVSLLQWSAKPVLKTFSYGIWRFLLWTGMDRNAGILGHPTQTSRGQNLVIFPPAYPSAASPFSWDMSWGLFKRNKCPTLPLWWKVLFVSGLSARAVSNTELKLPTPRFYAWHSFWDDQNRRYFPPSWKKQQEGQKEQAEKVWGKKKKRNLHLNYPAVNNALRSWNKKNISC